MNSARRTNIRANALVAVVVAVAGVLAAPIARAGAEPPTIAGWERSQAQRPLVEAAETIRAEVERGAHAGYAGIVLRDHDVTVWWKGHVPAAVTRAVEKASREATVRVEAAAHSEAELSAAAAEVRQWLDANPGSGFHGVKSPGDGSGLVLAAHPQAGAQAAAGLAALDRQVEVPLTVRHEEPLREVSRQNDSPPWWGGARTWNQTAGSLCTSGFGVRDSANRRYLLTAEHCGLPGHRIADRTGEYIGTVSRGHDDHDIAIIPTSSEDFMYVGGGDSNSGVKVVGWGHVFVGQYLCQSGVTSAEQTGGPVCDLKVVFFWQDREDLVEAEQAQGLTSARPGDSGGSVYSAGSGGVVANGTVTRAGGARIGFQDFATANRDFGVTIP